MGKYKGGLTMNTTFAAKKMNLTESFTDHAEKKLEKLDRFLIPPKRRSRFRRSKTQLE